jgi:hypothetical protein
MNASLPRRPSNFVNRRRSQRVLLAVRLEVSGKRLNKTSFEEETKTIIVNSHGALLHLKESVVNGQVLSLKNDDTNEKISCTVVDIFLAKRECRKWPSSLRTLSPILASHLSSGRLDLAKSGSQERRASQSGSL